MNILFVTEAFPPAPMVGSHRAAKVAGAFCAAGHRVHVLTLHGGVAGTSTVQPGLTVHRLEAGRTPRELVNSVKARLTGRNGHEAMSGAPVVLEDAATRRGGGRLRRMVLGLLWLPDDQQSLIPAAYGAGREAHRRQTVDLIYSTAPAFSTHVAALLLRRAIGSRWVAEFRDPWTDNAAERIAMQSAVTRAADRALEHAVLNRADAVVTNSERAADLFRLKLGPERSGRVICALNGIAAIRDRRVRASDGPLRLVYAGNLYPPRDPFPLLRAFAALRNCSDVPRFEIVFVGHVARYGDVDVQAYARELGLQDALRLIPYLPAGEAQDLVDTADLLLLPAQGWTMQVPNKLFDYLGSRVPILAIAESGSETDAMLQQAGGHFVVHADTLDEVPAVARAALVTAAARNDAGDPDVLQGWAVTPQMDRLVQDIMQIVSSSP